MKCHIIGNGYSRDLFEGTDDFKICLNVHSYDCDLLFAVDDIAIDYLLANNFYGKNVVISDHRKLEHEKIVGRVQRFRKSLPFEIEGMDSKRSSFNVGHCAYRWARRTGYEEIHLWGFDIFFNRSLVSLSDVIFGHSYEYKTDLKFRRKAEKYMQIWRRLIDAPTYVHMPMKEKIKPPIDDNEYVKGINHGTR